MSLLIGAIVIWSGSTFDIPDNWQLCDGTNGTPNLQNRFIVGAGDIYGVGDTGGFTDTTLVTHNHSASSSSSGSHTHSFGVSGSFGAVTIRSSNSGTGNENVMQGAGSHSHTVTVPNFGISPVNKNLPPYFALAFIQQIS